jgi:hypothetical protein
LIKDDQADSVDNDDIRLTDNVRMEEKTKEKTPVSLDKQAMSNNDDIRLTDNVRTKGQGKQQIAFCEYEPCGKEFIQSVSWKRFCCDDCRKLSWETTHGKKLNLKTAAS